MDQLMERARQLATENVRLGEEPFGAVLVEDSKFVTDGLNELPLIFDISRQAELNAIRKAQAELQSHDLSSYTKYASREFYPMCLSSLELTGVKGTDNVFVDDCIGAEIGASNKMNGDLKERLGKSTLNQIQLPLRENQENQMKLWKEW